jgi:hypothetical protein
MDDYSQNWYSLAMVYLLVLAALGLLPGLLILAAKSNGAIAFMSLCLGSVLVSFVAPDMVDFITSMFRMDTLSVTQIVKIALLVVPFVLAILFTKGSVAGGKILTNFIPSISSGMLFALLLTPLLSANLQKQIIAQPLWHQLSSLQTAVVISGAFFSLLFLLIAGRVHHADDKHKKH